MNISANSEPGVRISDGAIVIKISGEPEIRIPAVDNARLAKGTAERLHRFELSPYGIHWPELDEDLSSAGLLAGDWGQPRHVASVS